MVQAPGHPPRENETPSEIDRLSGDQGRAELRSFDPDNRKPARGLQSTDEEHANRLTAVRAFAQPPRGRRRVDCTHRP